uniref:NADP-dependent oxidoreductase n=1 Tax=Paraconexibacter sp. TaxID=2949640 RepID=UPI00356B3854
MPVVNHQLRLASRPVGLPDDQNWSFTEEEIDPTASPDAGTFLVKVLYLSLDPAMRGWMNEGRSYIPPVGIGEIMRALAVGEVVASANDAFPVGAYVSGVFGAQEYATSDGSGVTVVDPDLAALPTYLGVLGMTGMTAYFGLLEEAKPVEGDTVVVSGAAGAVGSVVGQIAKLKGCHVIGIAGGEEKCRMIIEEFGFDAAIDYKDADVAKALRDLAPKGVDIYFDNVGGDILDAVL